MIYAGIDEAGYGPLLGPMVIARCVFSVAGRDPSLLPPSLWRLLQGAVCRLPGDRRERIAVGDSKSLYTPSAGLGELERGVLSFLGSAGVHPDRLQPLLDILAFDELSHRTDHPCYRDEGGGPALPVKTDAAALRTSIERLDRSSLRAGVRLEELKAAVVFEDRFNRMVHDCGNKALCAWTFVAGHLEEIWNRYGERHPHVVIDRQGGRIYYVDLLSRLFPQARLCIQEETPAVSRYEIAEGERSMRVTVKVESEREHFPAAFASMSAKYLRELLMMRYQGFWLRHAPEVRPTFGYYRDGRRFLLQIEPLLRSLDLDRDLLVRRC